MKKGHTFAKGIAKQMSLYQLLQQQQNVKWISLSTNDMIMQKENNLDMHNFDITNISPTKK